MQKSPNVAGTFYPAEPAELQQLVAQFLAGKSKISQGKVRIIIVPHAGYCYSGAVAGVAFAALKQTLARNQKSQPKIAVLAPAHFCAVENCVTANFTNFVTPLGAIPAQPFPGYPVQNVAFSEEHALEVELPFLQKITLNFTLYPLLIGGAKYPELTAKLTDFLAEPSTYAVISSDLSHYYPEEVARKMDLNFCAASAQGDLATVQRGEACGKSGILAALLFAQRQNLQVQFLEYTNSAQVTGDAVQVVGYGAFALTESES